MTTFRTLSLAGATALLALSGPALAAQHDGQAATTERSAKAGHARAGGHKQHRQQRGHFLRKLDLSAEQRSEIGQIMRESRSEGRAEMRQLREEIRASIEAGGYNEDQVRILIESNAQLLVDNMVRAVRLQAAIDAVLTEEQRASLREMRGRPAADRPHGARGQRQRGS